MKKDSFFEQLKVASILFILMTILTGLIYPLTVTVILQVLFPWQSNGSIITKNGAPIGSYWIGQSFNHPAYFWGRPSATTPYAYNAANSSGSNMGPSNADFLAAVKKRVTNLHTGTDDKSLVPVDLVTASGSGLDPEISPFAAFYQTKRIAAARHIPEAEIINTINMIQEKRTFGILGEPRVNVLALNLALDNLRTTHAKQKT